MYKNSAYLKKQRKDRYWEWVYTLLVMGMVALTFAAGFMLIWLVS